MSNMKANSNSCSIVSVSIGRVAINVFQCFLMKLFVEIIVTNTIFQARGV